MVPVAMTVLPPAATSAVMIPFGSVVPLPVVKTRASSAAFASANSAPICCAMLLSS